jgi:hypothetical protein
MLIQAKPSGTPAATGGRLSVQDALRMASSPDVPAIDRTAALAGILNKIAGGTALRLGGGPGKVGSPSVISSQLAFEST